VKTARVAMGLRLAACAKFSSRRNGNSHEGAHFSRYIAYVFVSLSFYFWTTNTFAV